MTRQPFTSGESEQWKRDYTVNRDNNLHGDSFADNIEYKIWNTYWIKDFFMKSCNKIGF